MSWPRWALAMSTLAARGANHIQPSAQGPAKAFLALNRFRCVGRLADIRACMSWGAGALGSPSGIGQTGGLGMAGFISCPCVCRQMPGPRASGCKYIEERQTSFPEHSVLFFPIAGGDWYCPILHVKDVCG